MNDSIQDHKNKLEHSNNLTGCVFNMQAFVNLAQQVFGAKDVTSADFEKDCDFLRYLCDEIEGNVSKIRGIIPTKRVEGEIS